MEVINFDDDHDDDKTRHYFLFPDCHYMIIAPTGQGKTNLLLNMLLNSKQGLCYDKCIIYTINPDQHKYKLLVNFFETVKKEMGDDILTIESPENVVAVQDLDSSLNKVIIFDDIKLDTGNMNQIKEYFSLSRNKNCNCIYLTQSYYDVPKYIRRNTKCFVIFGNLDNKDIRQLADDHSCGVTKDEFKQIYHEAVSDKYSFLVIDKTTKCIPQMYRKRFDGFYFPKF